MFAICHSYTRFLDACTSLTHTVLKVLEEFSQDKRIFVKSRRQRKAKDSVAEGESESDDERGAARRVAEKSFQFSSFESVCRPNTRLIKKFVNDQCITTFRTFLSHYPELRPDQIKRVLVFFHRIFVKRKQQVIMYRLDICELLLRMVRDEVNIPRGAPIRKHLEDFFKHYTHALTKTLIKSPALYVEATSYNPFLTRRYYSRNSGVLCIIFNMAKKRLRLQPHDHALLPNWKFELDLVRKIRLV